MDTLPPPSDSPETAAESQSGLRELLIRNRLIILLSLHLVIFASVYWCAFLMRFTLSVPHKYVNLFITGLPLVLAIKVGVFLFMRSFHGWWRHVHFSDVISLVKSCVVASVAVVVADHFLMSGQIPRTVVLNDFVMCIVVIGGLRSTWRVWDERIAPLDKSRIRDRALLVGNDHSAAKLAHLINGQHQLKTRVVGLVSKNPNSKGRRYSDLKVVGHLGGLTSLIKQHRANTLFVVSGAIPAKQLRDLLDTSSDSGFKIKILPLLEDQLRGMDQLPIREVSYDDLLRRKPVTLDLGSIERIIENKTILVTGAGGSIGSELCRQLSRFGPSRIILLGRGENRIYHIEKELNQQSLVTEYVPRIANITDSARMREVFDTYRPELVFHAAAHKHVPLVEYNVGESIINNVLGTRVVADLADEFGVERFVLISTDKAVNPTSVMGCTKQMAERYCQTLGGKSDTMFICTRFGNVLGSAGSVVPLFQKQIREGGPITITDKRMPRYFMTIPEASQLVIQAAAMGNGGEIFVLEMGEPVKILDLAKDLIRLAGHPSGSIDIVERGMRPGEKLYEELYYENEKSLPTKHDQILTSYSRIFSMGEVRQQVEELIAMAYKSPGRIRARLSEYIPEFAYESRESKQELESTSDTNKQGEVQALEVKRRDNGSSPANLL